MNLILHGDNVVISRQKLTEQIKANQAKEIIRLDGKKLDQTQLIQALESQSLFGDEKLVVIENLLTRQRSKEKDQLIAIIADPSQQTPVILWEPKEATKPNLNKLKNFQATLFKTPASIFKFLDSFRPGSAKLLLNLVHNQLKTETPELIFYMLSRRVSDLIIANDPKSIPLLKGAPWQKTRLISQAKAFTQDQLLALHRQLLKIDESIKTGTNILPLASQLDLMLAKV